MLLCDDELRRIEGLCDVKRLTVYGFVRGNIRSSKTVKLGIDISCKERDVHLGMVAWIQNTSVDVAECICACEILADEEGCVGVDVCDNVRDIVHFEVVINLRKHSRVCAWIVFEEHLC